MAVIMGLRAISLHTFGSRYILYQQSRTKRQVRAVGCCSDSLALVVCKVLESCWQALRLLYHLVFGKARREAQEAIRNLAELISTSGGCFKSLGAASLSPDLSKYMSARPCSQNNS